MNNSSTDAFEDVPTCSRIPSTIITSVISFASLAAFIGNSLVTITFLMNTTLRTSTNYFIVNMAVSDLLSSSTNWPLYATEGMLSRKHLIQDSMANFVCKLGTYSRAVSQAVSVLSLLMIVVDRYIAIVLPFKAIHVTKRLRVVLLLFTWALPLLVGFPYAWLCKIVKEGGQTFCGSFESWSTIEIYSFYSVGFLIFYFVPLILIIILYSRIMKRLRQTRPGEGGQEAVTKRTLHQNQIVMKVFLWIVSAFFICWTPLCVYIVLMRLFPSIFSKDSCMLYSGFFYYVFPSLSTVINPIILFKYGSRFSKALKEMFSRFTCKPPRTRCFGGRRVSPKSNIVQMQAS